MKTTYESRSISSLEIEAVEHNPVELGATLGTVFLRTGFGQVYLSPASLLKGIAVLAGVMMLIYFGQLPLIPNPGSPLAAAIVLAALILGVAGVLGTPTSLAAWAFVALATSQVLRPWFEGVAHTDVRTVGWTFLAFAILFLAAAGWQIVRTGKRGAVLPLACGHSSPLWMSVPSWLRPWRSERHVQRFAEPVLVALVGVVILGVFHNWFGAFLICVAACIGMSASSRFRREDGRGQRSSDFGASEVKTAGDFTKTERLLSDSFGAIARPGRSALPQNDAKPSARVGRPIGTVDQRARSKFAQPAITASDVQCKPPEYLKGIATLGTVFLRSRFGELYLTPSSLLKGSAIIAGALFFARFNQDIAWSSKADLSLGVGMWLMAQAAFVLFWLMPRNVIVALFSWLAAFYLLDWLARSQWNWYADATRTGFATIAWSFFCFGVLYMIVAALHILRSSTHEPPLALSCGRSSPLWMRVPSSLRLWRDEWDVQRFAEPALLAVVGLLLIGVFSNWLGGFLLLVAIAVSASATVRFRDLSRTVAEMASATRAAAAISVQVDAAVETKPSPSSRARPFVARPARDE